MNYYDTIYNHYGLKPKMLKYRSLTWWFSRWFGWRFSWRFSWRFGWWFRASCCRIDFCKILPSRGSLWYISAWFIFKVAQASNFLPRSQLIIFVTISVTLVAIILKVTRITLFAPIGVVILSNVPSTFYGFEMKFRHRKKFNLIFGVKDYAPEGKVFVDEASRDGWNSFFTIQLMFPCVAFSEGQKRLNTWGNWMYFLPI